MKNRPEIVFSYFACFYLGAIAVPLNSRYQAAEAQYAMNHCGCKLLIVDPEFYTRVADLCPSTPTLEKIVVVGGAHGQAESYEAFLENAPAMVEWPEVKPHDPAAIFYTSGTTDRPKGVMHTHYSLYQGALNQVMSRQFKPDDVVLAATHLCSLAASGGLMLPCAYVGSTVAILPDFEPADFLQTLERTKANVILLYSGELIGILDHPLLAETDLSSLQCCICGGEKLPMELHRRFKRRLGFELTEGCGMTECEGYATNPPYGEKRPGSIGKPVHGTTLKLVDQKGQEVPAGETGQILVKSKAVMAGYWDDPIKTREALQEGWLYTGDLARRDEDGYYWFVGRIKEIIIRGGSNIAPGEVEDVIDMHPAVKRAAVIGVPDPKWGAIVKAYVMLEPDVSSQPTEDELRAFALEKLAAYKVPEIWEFVEHLPTTVTGKLDRKAIHNLSSKHV